MEETMKLLNDILSRENLILCVLSNLRKKGQDSYTKVDVKPVMIKEEFKYQFTFYYKNKVMHDNLNSSETLLKLEELLKETFKQGVLFTTEADYQILISKKGKVSILKNNPSKERIHLSHNRNKQYILEDGSPVDFLIRLGVMNESGKVVSKRYDKFKQINRFLEMVSDVISKIDHKGTINIIDFGCGKSYLTFALYHYLVNILKLDVNIVGLDLKEDVINFCNDVAGDLDFDRLKFIYGDIQNYQGFDKVDMVVTLHACDTATDAALIKAVNWNAQAILSVPCCQHELYDKIQNPILEPMLKHGIIREKVSSLITDSIRGNILEILGYQVQLLEFIDMEHTPKNILIRAIRTNNSYNKDAINSYIKMKEFFELESLYIEEELGDKLKMLLEKQ